MHFPIIDLLAVLFLLMAFVPHRVLFFFAISTLVHEAGHLLAVKLMSIKVKKMRVEGFRAVIEAEEGEDDLSTIIILSSGPFLNFILSGFLLTLGTSYVVFAAFSFSLGVINLLPVRHFDGGRILCIFLRRFLGSKAHGFVMILSDVTLFFLIFYSAFRMLNNGDSTAMFLFGISSLITSRKNEDSSGKHIQKRGFGRK